MRQTKICKTWELLNVIASMNKKESFNKHVAKIVETTPVLQLIKNSSKKTKVKVSNLYQLDQIKLTNLSNKFFFT